MSNTRCTTRTLQPESFAFTRAATRSTEPEVFTFERLPAAQATAVSSFVPIRPKRRCTRVMYPAKVRMHLPPPERSQAKRWLLVLVLVLLWQIYTEEPCAESPQGGADRPAPDYQASASACDASVPGSGCSRPGPEPLEQSAGNSYMVALLVYHRLGSDN